MFMLIFQNFSMSQIKNGFSGVKNEVVQILSLWSQIQTIWDQDQIWEKHQNDQNFRFELCLKKSLLSAFWLVKFFQVSGFLKFVEF